MTLEELRAKLKEEGIPHDGWTPSPGGPVTPPIIERHKELLGKVVELLQGQVERDKEELSRLHAVRQRLEHGGGV